MTLVRKQIAKDDLHTVSEEYWDGDLEGLADFLNFQRSFEERLQAIAFSLDDELERRGLPRWCWKVIIEKDREKMARCWKWRAPDAWSVFCRCQRIDLGTC